MYVTDQDYIVVEPTALAILQRSDATVRESAETTAAEEIRGYLSARYDVDREFSRTLTSRNMKLVQVFCDIVLYALISAQPGRMGYDIRKERYERAIEWLQGVQNGKISPTLPAIVTDEGQTQSAFIVGSEPKLHHNW
jgi:phage gp36-like protein